MSESPDSDAVKSLHWIWLLVSGALGLVGGVGGSQVVRNTGSIQTVSCEVISAKVDGIQSQIDRRLGVLQNEVDNHISQPGHGDSMKMHVKEEEEINTLRRDVDRLMIREYNAHDENGRPLK